MSTVRTSQKLSTVKIGPYRGGDSHHRKSLPTDKFLKSYLSYNFKLVKLVNWT